MSCDLKTRVADLEYILKLLKYDEKNLIIGACSSCGQKEVIVDYNIPGISNTGILQNDKLVCYECIENAPKKKRTYIAYY